MKGLLLAGGNGTRMWPSTHVISKHLLPCYDRPTIYYPLATLIELGVTDIAIVCRDKDRREINLLLSDLLENLNINLTTISQNDALGLAHAIVQAKHWIANQPFWMILGDNIFSHAPIVTTTVGALGLVKRMADPRAFGVVEIDPKSFEITRIEEKPANPFSNLALTGLYHFDQTAVYRSAKLIPSARGELEITSLFLSYMDDSRALAFEYKEWWFDNGTPDQMFYASEFVRDMFKIKQQIIGSPELSALKAGRITTEVFTQLLWRMPDCHYRLMLSLAPI